MERYKKQPRNKIDELREDGYLVIHGNATTEEALEKAGIQKAKAIVCTLSTDADNVFTVLTARQMNPDIYIVSKAIDSNSHKKLLKAGANKTISPNEIGGQRIAAHIIRPSIVSFFDVFTKTGGITLDLEEISIPKNSRLIGQKLFEAKIPDKTGLVILAVRSKDMPDYRFNPGPDELITEGDIFLVLGKKEQTEELLNLVSSSV